MPGLQRHEDEAAGVRLCVWDRDDRDPAPDLRVLAGCRDCRRVVRAEGSQGNDAVTQRRVRRVQRLGHEPKYAASSAGRLALCEPVSDKEEGGPVRGTGPPEGIVESRR